MFELSIASLIQIKGDLSQPSLYMVAIFYPFSLFCETVISLLSLQTQPNTAPNLFQRGVEYGKYALASRAKSSHRVCKLSSLACLFQRRNNYMYIYIYIYREREIYTHICITLSLSLYVYIYI